jgi:cobalt/nickel transport system permease protein
MHLAEGVLPARAALAWWLVAAAAVAVAVRGRRRIAPGPDGVAFLAMMAAAVFAISCLPVPVPTAGTCSHPCGTGLAAILVGPLATILVTTAALLLQALFLAHGGLSTLGADIVSMGLVGGLVGWLVFHGARRFGAPMGVAAFAAGLTSDWATYATTAFQLASALDVGTSMGASLRALALGFAPTQVPLGVLEGMLCAGSLRFLARRRPDLLPFPVSAPQGSPRPREVRS